MKTQRTVRYTVNSAIKEVLLAVGSPEEVACVLWPDKTPDAAARYLSDCLNPNRPAHLWPEDLITIARIGRKRDCHAVVDLIARECGYKIKKIKREDRITRLIRQKHELSEVLREVQEEIERSMLEPETIMRDPDELE